MHVRANTVECPVCKQKYQVVYKHQFAVLSLGYLVLLLIDLLAYQLAFDRRSENIITLLFIVAIFFPLMAKLEPHSRILQKVNEEEQPHSPK